MGLLHTLGASRAFFVDQPLPLAAVEVGAKVDQRSDHLLAPLHLLRQRERRRRMGGQHRKHALLQSRITAGARHADHADRPIAGLK